MKLVLSNGFKRWRCKKSEVKAVVIKYHSEVKACRGHEGVETAYAGRGTDLVVKCLQEVKMHIYDDVNVVELLGEVKECT